MPGRFFWKTGAGSLKATTPLTSSYRKNNSSRRDRKNNPLGEGERSCDRKNNSSRGDRKSKFDGERHQKNPALTATSYTSHGTSVFFGSFNAFSAFFSKHLVRIETSSA